MPKDTKPTGAKPLPLNNRPGHWGGTPHPEVLDPTPLEMPAGYGRPVPLQEMIAQALANHTAMQTDSEPESYLEADDFEVDDDELLDFSPYTLKEVKDVEPDLSALDAETQEAFRDFLRARKSDEQAAPKADPPPEPSAPSEGAGSA